MSNVFDKAIEIAKKRMEWEAKVNPKNESRMFAPINEAEQEESQKFIDTFQAEIVKASKAAGFKTVEEAKAAFSKMPTAKIHPLRAMSEICIPVSSTTMLVAQELAPIRVATVENLRAGNFGQFLPANDKPDGVLVHKAKDPVSVPGAPRGDAARALEESRAEVQGVAFDAMAAAFGGGIKATKAKRAGVPKALDDLGGVRVVEGEVRKVPARGQIGMFDEEQAPVPSSARKAPKAGK